MPSRKTRILTGIGGGLPGGLLRFAIFIPFGVYGRLAGNHWNVIKDHPELHDGIYSSTIAVGEKIAAKWGFFGFCWGFAAWIPAILLPPPFSIIFAFVDAAIAGYIAHATHLLAGYSPTNAGACLGSGAHEFQLPPGTNESFFDAAARLNATTTDSTRMCNSFVQEWHYGVAISVVYGIIAFLNVVFCIVACMSGYWEAQRERRSFWKALLHSAAASLRLFAIGIVALIYWLPVLFFRFLPIAIKARVRFARQYGVKAAEALEEKGEIHLKTFAKKFSGEREENVYSAKGNTEPTNLADFLRIYDMLMLVAEHLHYEDIVNLGLVSRSVREAVLPSDAHAQRIVHFKMYTCHRKTKRECWSCKMQICKKCRHTHTLKQTTPYFHLDACRPYCTTCYYRIVHTAGTQALRQRPMDPRICRHAPPTATPNLLQKWFRGSAYYVNLQVNLPKVTKYVCKECSRLDDAGLTKKRLQRTKWELRGHERQDCSKEEMEKCRNCKVALGSGPRWWVCKMCKKECTSMLHLAWVTAGDRNANVEAEGEQAV